MQDQELQPVFQDSPIPKSSGTMRIDRDRADLIRLGKRPVLRVGLSLPITSVAKTDLFYLVA